MDELVEVLERLAMHEFSAINLWRVGWQNDEEYKEEKGYNKQAKQSNAYCF